MKAIVTVCLVLQAELEELGKAEDRSKVEKFLSTGAPVPSIANTLLMSHYDNNI